MDSYAYYNGIFDKKENVKIPLSDRSIYFGDAVYDAMIGSYDRIHWENDHLDRFLLNAKKIGIRHKYSKTFLSSLMHEIGVKSGMKTYLMYCQLSRNLADRNHSARGCGANLLITVDPIKIPKNPPPMKLISMPDLRYGYCDIKTVNLIPAVISATKAEKMGFDEAVFINNGFVTECTKSNISIIKQGRIITHPKDNKILPGIAREHLLKICHEEKIDVIERPFTFQELICADEILVTSTTKLCRRVSLIDNFNVGSNDANLSCALCTKLYDDFSAFCDT